MSSLSYCRFQNTLKDLRDCYTHILDVDLSDDENAARRRLVDVCLNIIDELGGEVGEIEVMLDDPENWE